MQQPATAEQQDEQNADAGPVGDNSAVVGGMQDDDDENMAEGLGAADANQQEAQPNAQAGDDDEEEKHEEPERDHANEGATAVENDQEDGKPMTNPYMIENDEDQAEELTQDPKHEEYVLLVFLINNQDRRDARVTIVFDQ